MPNREELLYRVATLEREIGRLRGGLFDPAGESTVIVPDALKEQFEAAQKTVGEYFQNVNAAPARGMIEVGEERYLLIRASALSIDFFDTVRQLYADRGEQEAAATGRRVLFDIAHAIGINDARTFGERMNVSDPIDKLSAGPVHFAYTGWARVEIKPESAPAPDDSYLLIYDHPYSFEAASWLRAGRVSDNPVCIMNAGYSSGWCQESFGIALVAVEFCCQAMGDPHCRFIMAPPSRIEERLEQFATKLKVGDSRLDRIAIPEFLENKRLEEELAQARLKLEQRVALRTTELSTANTALKKEIAERERLEQQLRKVADTNRALASQVMAAQEDERQRVARELHDSIGQVLVALRMDAEWIADHADKDGDVGTRARGLQEHLTDTLGAVRTVVHDLRPPVLDDLGIASALESFANDVSRRHKIRCDTSVSVACDGVTTEVATAIYRIAQEALNNVVRHSGARTAQVALKQRPGALELTVSDDGCGFDVAAAEADALARTSMGLVSMRQRASLLNGSLSIESSAGNGTTVVARLPCCFGDDETCDPQQSVSNPDVFVAAIDCRKRT